MGGQMKVSRARTRLAVVGSLVSIFLAQMSTPTSAAWAAGSGPEPGTEDLRAAIETREALGFPADPQVVFEVLQRQDTTFD